MQIEVRTSTDLFTVDAQAYAHGCNSLGVMGAGVALKVRLTYPDAYEQYKKYCKQKNYVKKELVGAAQLVTSTSPWIFNLFTQYEMGRHAQLEYVNSAFKEMFRLARMNSIETIAIPQIGAGIGGLVWEDVLYQIEKAEQDEPWDGTLIIAIRD